MKLQSLGAPHLVASVLGLVLVGACAATSADEESLSRAKVADEGLEGLAKPPPKPKECKVDSDCNSGGNSCIAAETCVRKVCVPTPVADGTPCDDGNACTVGDSCQGGVCTPGPDNCLPDLFIQNVVLGDGGITPNGYTVTVLNEGNAFADLSGVFVSGLYSTDTVVDAGDRGACGASFNNGTSLRPGGTITIVVGCSIAPITGPPLNEQYLLVTVDSTHIVTESKEDNNVFQLPLPVP
jgi:hypothetical protein